MRKAIHFDKELTEWQNNNSETLNKKDFIKKLQQNNKNNLAQKIINKRKSRPSSSPVKSIDINNSMNELRFLAQNEQQQSLKITNRLKYLNTSSQRQQKLLTSAKLKFIKVNEIRRKSFTDKSFFQKQRQTLLRQYQKTVILKASKVKSEKNKSSQSQKRLIIEKHNLAKAVKQQRNLNQSFIKQNKQRQRYFLSQKVQKIQRQEQIQRLKNESRSKQKIQQGIINHKKEILNQFKKVQRQLKANQKKLKKFNEKVDEICDKKMKQQQMLGQFRNFLGLNKNLPKHKIHKSPYDEGMKSMRIQKSNRQKGIRKQLSSCLERKNIQKDIYLTNPEG